MTMNRMTSPVTVFDVSFLLVNASQLVAEAASLGRASLGSTRATNEARADRHARPNYF
jgi:hypothetical protein